MSGGFNVQFTGDWEKLKYTLNYLNTRYRMDAILLQQDQAERVKKAIEDKVFTLTGKPYDPRRPENTGVWWIETLELMSQLEVRKVSSGDSAYFIGFGEGTHKNSGLKKDGTPISYNEIAQLNEDNHPLIEPTWQELEADFLKEWQELVQKATRGGV